MKKIIISLLCIGLVACKDNRVEPGTVTATLTSTTTGNISKVFDPTGQTLLLSGTFVSGVHNTSGNVKVYIDKDKNRSVVVDNFKTDAGPDLRIYLSENVGIKNFIEISDKVITQGDFVVKLPAAADLEKQKSLLIWCKQFSVLFGSAELK